jgi:hypothetical protein
LRKNLRRGTITLKITVVLCLVSLCVVTPLGLGLSMNLIHTASNANTASTTTKNTTSQNSTTMSSGETTTSHTQTMRAIEFGPLPANYKIAFVKPVFTATAYSSFYGFYGLNALAKPGQIIRTHLNLLNATLVNTWGWSSDLGNFINS